MISGEATFAEFESDGDVLLLTQNEKMSASDWILKS